MKILNYKNLMLALLTIGFIAILIIVSCFLSKWLGYVDISFFLEAHGSLIAGLAAVVVAAITIVFQGKYTREQITESRSLAVENRYLEKREVVLMRLSRVRGKLDKFREASYVTKNKEERDFLSIEIRDDLLEIVTIARSHGISYQDELYALAEIGNILYYSLIYYESSLKGAAMGGNFVDREGMENLVSGVMVNSRMPDEIMSNIFIPVLKSLIDGENYDDGEIAEWLVFNLYSAICSIRGEIFFNISSQSSVQDLLPKFKIRDDQFS